MLTNAQWAAGLIRCCIQQGVCDFCIAPGSRSAPLAIASFYAEQSFPDVNIHTHFDERGLAFYALGLARAHSRPVVIITTSGTAVANLYPAVVEAWQTSKPIWVFSADRPDALLNCGANQAIQQKNLFGENVSASVNLVKPTDDNGLQLQLSSLSRLVKCDGPVQVNCQLEEPLYQAESEYQQGLMSAPIEAYRETPIAIQIPMLDDAMANINGNVVIVLGALSPAEAEVLKPWLQTVQCPIIADIASQFRFADLPQVIHYADVLLLNSQSLNADSVVQFGGRIVSKRVNQWLDGSAAKRIIFDQYKQPLALPEKAQQFCVAYDQLLEWFGTRPFIHAQLKSIQSKNSFLAKNVELLVKRQWSEAAVCFELIRAIRGKVALFAGNSLSIRMLDCYSGRVSQLTSSKAASQIAVFANRGASGIDGLVATAAGLANGDYEQLVAVIGDVSLLHDINSLHLVAKSKKPIKIIVLNNDGGQIFSMLPAAEQAGYNALFSMPHGYGFKQASTQFGLKYSCAHDYQGFETELKKWLNVDTSAVLECCLTNGSEQLKNNLQILTEEG